jgi:hypothetical protein
MSAAPIFTTEEVAAFTELRAAVFAGIKRALEYDGYCKPYEGGMSISLPNYFEAKDGAWVTVHLYCYVLGSEARNYQWTGETLGEAVKLAQKSLADWIVEFEQQVAEEASANG